MWMGIFVCLECQQKKGRPGTSYSAVEADVLITDGGKGIFLGVDGKQFGPYTRVKIARADCAMPFAHYIPIIE